MLSEYQIVPILACECASQAIILNYPDIHPLSKTSLDMVSTFHPHSVPNKDFPNTNTHTWA